MDFETSQRFLALEQRIAALEERLGVQAEPPYVPGGLQPPQAYAAQSAYGDVPEEALAYIRAGQKIQAIKIVREHTGLGLADAKNMVDDVASRMGF